MHALSMGSYAWRVVGVQETLACHTPLLGSKPGTVLGRGPVAPMWVKVVKTPGHPQHPGPLGCDSLWVPVRAPWEGEWVCAPGTARAPR